VRCGGGVVGAPIPDSEIVLDGTKQAVVVVRCTSGSTGLRRGASPETSPTPKTAPCCSPVGRIRDLRQRQQILYGEAPVARRTPPPPILQPCLNHSFCRAFIQGWEVESLILNILRVCHLFSVTAGIPSWQMTYRLVIRLQRT